MIRGFKNYTEKELMESGIIFGKDVNISNDVIFHNPDRVLIGNNVRIDTQCVFIAGKNTSIIIGNNVHIAAGCYFYGNSGNIVMDDYTCTSAKCLLYTSNDDYTEGYMTNSVVDGKMKNVKTGNIYIMKHTVVGCASIILPGVILEYATSVGANSLVKNSTKPFYVIAGTPAKFIKMRKNVNLEI